MKRTIVPNAGPKLKLIEAAEKLFAENGFDVVSVRDITQAAGSNVAAVNYHFGSRDGLVAVVMTRYMTPVNEDRLLRLDLAERNWAGKAIPVEDVIDAFVRPLMTKMAKSDLSEQLYFKLIGRICSLHNAGIPAEIEAQFKVLIDRFIRAISKSLPHLTEEELLWRLHFVVGAMIHMLVHGASLRRLSQGLAGAPDMALSVTRLLGFAVAGLCDGAPGQQVNGVAQSPELNGHTPPPTTNDLVPPAPTEKKAAKKSPQKVAPDSPQVMFDFQ
jgi:AcrR family transcriptional regulator